MPEASSDWSSGTLGNKNPVRAFNLLDINFYE